MKIPKKHANKLFIFLTSVFMSFLMSGVVTLTNIGLASNFFLKWAQGWGFAFLVGYPIISLVIPLARKIVDKATNPNLN